MNQRLRAAFAKVKITPEEHAPLQGYDPTLYIAAPDRDILDDLYARVLLLDDGDVRRVVISVDCCLTNETPFLANDPTGQNKRYRYLGPTFPEGTRREWGEAAGTAAPHVSVHATHTHSAPAYFGKKYTARIAEALRSLPEKLRPVRLKAAAGPCTVAVNRRPRLQHNEALSVDRTLHLLWFETDEGRPLGAMVNCAVHPTLLMNPFSRVTTEFVGLAMNELESACDDGFVSLFIQGFAGDVGPYGHSRMETEDTYPLVLEFGRRFYGDIAGLKERLAPLRELPLKSAETIVALPARREYYQREVAVTLHGLRIGDAALLSVSGEIFNGYVSLIGRHSPFRPTLFSGVANGYSGYLPTPAAFRDGLGGYEMNTTPYAEEAGPAFVQAAAQLLAHLSD